jgi:hypothetical protein
LVLFACGGRDTLALCKIHRRLLDLSGGTAKAWSGAALGR